jgi:hypothetical protein
MLSFGGWLARAAGQRRGLNGCSELLIGGFAEDGDEFVGDDGKPWMARGPSAVVRALKIGVIRGRG